MTQQRLNTNTRNKNIAEFVTENAILREANQKLCEGAEAENQRALKAEVERDVYREALERIAGTRIDGKACDIIADCKDYTEALEKMAEEALQRAGGGG